MYELSDQVSIGATYEETLPLFQAYYEEHRDSGAEIQFNPDPNNFGIYHWVFMDDLQLNLRFDEERKVSHIEFIDD